MLKNKVKDLISQVFIVFRDNFVVIGQYRLGEKDPKHGLKFHQKV